MRDNECTATGTPVPANLSPTKTDYEHGVAHCEVCSEIVSVSRTSGVWVYRAHRAKEGTTVPDIADDDVRYARAAEVAEYSETEHGTRFLRQNDYAAFYLSREDVEYVDAYSEHHAGGAYVLIRYTRLPDGTNGYAKVHDSWGDPGENGGHVVLHTYGMDEDSNPLWDEVRYFTNGAHALRAFLDLPDSVCQHTDPDHEGDAVPHQRGDGPTRWYCGRHYEA